MNITLEQAQSIAASYMEAKYDQGTSYSYGFSCDECGSSVVARDRKKLVRKSAWRTLCWNCMDAGVDMHCEPKRTPEEITKAGGRC